MTDGEANNPEQPRSAAGTSPAGLARPSGGEAERARPVPAPAGHPRAASPLPPSPPLSPAAERALAEAEARRASAGKLNLPPEQGGREGPEPVRFGDWERRGIAVDF